jgi:glycosyltransferase involved in cell wall biosynthesis
MHVLFLHTNFPAQFGQVAVQLADRYQYRCTFASEKPSANIPQIEQIQFTAASGAHAATHHATRSIENLVWKSQAIYDVLKQRPDIKPDVIVAHSGFVSPIFLRELYPGVPHIGYFEYFYHARSSDMDFRSDLPLPPEQDFLRVRVRNAKLLLDLHNCDVGYSPTDFQRSQLPAEFQSKIETIFDGIDIDFWQPAEVVDRTFNGFTIPANHRVLTYVSRGFEALRGFDMFLQVADRVCKARQDVSVIVVGEDRVAYGGDERYTEGKTFAKWTIDRYQPDLSRIHFLGRLSPTDLSRLFALSDLHLYWTVPFVLSWSLMNALSCGCTLIGSDTAPVREMIRDGQNGMLCDFFDIDRWVDRSLEVLASPAKYRSLGQRGRQMIVDRYQVRQAVDKMNEMLCRV